MSLIALTTYLSSMMMLRLERNNEDKTIYNYIINKIYIHTQIHNTEYNRTIYLSVVEREVLDYKAPS